MTVVKPNGWTAILAAPGTYPRPVRRSEAGANPALSRNCDASAPAGDEPGRLLFADELSPRRKGGSRGTAAGPPPSASSGGFLCSKAGTPRLWPWRLSSSRLRPPPHTGRRSPTRIVSLSPTATEDLFAIGAGKQVVAVDNQSNYPANAPLTKLSGYTPNAEAIAGYQPDLVVVSFDGNHIVEALGKLKIPVLVEPTASKLAQAYGQITQLGAKTGHASQAAAVVAKMKAQIATAVASVPHDEGLTVYHELEPDLYSATSKTFIGRIYTLLGLKDIADAADKTGSGYPKLSQEYIVAASPKLIVLADTICCGQTPAKVAKRARLGDDRGGQGRRRARGERRHRLALGAAGRRLRPAGRGPDRRCFPASEHRGRAGGEGTLSSASLPRRGPSGLSSGRSCSCSCSTLIGLLVGPANIGAGPIVREVLSHVPLLGVHSHLSATDSAILWQLRAPRVVLGLLVGGMLALAGGAYQGVFRNPLVDPYLLGVAAGAGLGATIAIAYFSATDELVRPAADRSVPRRSASASLLAYTLGASAEGGRNPAALVLAGVTVVAFLTAIQTFIQQQHSQSLQEVYSWILGSVDTAGLARGRARAAVRRDLVDRRPAAPAAARRAQRSETTRRRRSACNVRRVRLTIVAAATIGTAAVVAFSGLIGFVGIIVPHAIRLAIGTSYRIVLPLSLLVGGGFLVLCDVIARTVVVAGRAADRRRDRVLRRAVLRGRPPHEQELPVTALVLDSLSVAARIGADRSTASARRSRRASGSP